jgi:hypothetical protein
VARLNALLHPARALERAGLAGPAVILRRAAQHIRWLMPFLRPRNAVPLTVNWLAEPVGRRCLRILDQQELRATRRSDTVFVFGSGRSLTEIPSEDWARIAEHDTVGFSHFHRQQWVRVDYHLIAEISPPFYVDTLESFRSNPRYAQTIYGLMKGWSAEVSNKLVARRLLPAGSRAFRWRRIERGVIAPPGTSLERGLVHGTNSLVDVVNFALVLGWREIVIAGVDLYNKEYFWLPTGVARPDEKPIFTADSRWPQADHMIDTFRLWRRLVEPSGVRISVYNPRSLLGEALPIHEPA